MMRAFFDTNVVVYALFRDDPRKQQIAQDLMHRHSVDQTLVLSTQVLLETFNVLVVKRKLARSDALDLLQVLATRKVVTSTANSTLSALALAVRYQVSGWDAAMLQAALDGDCTVFYSEDLQAGQRFGTLEVVNPFDGPAAHAPTAAYIVTSTPAPPVPPKLRRAASAAAAARRPASRRPRK